MLYFTLAYSSLKCLVLGNDIWHDLTNVVAYETRIFLL